MTDMGTKLKVQVHLKMWENAQNIFTGLLHLVGLLVIKLQKKHLTCFNVKKNCDPPQ